MTTRDRIRLLHVEAGRAGDAAQVEMCVRALAGDEGAISDCLSVCRAALNDKTDVRLWAAHADEGDYFAYFWQGERDQGSRCGWSDSALSSVGRELRERGLTLRTDDTGIVVARLRIEGDT